MIKIEGLCYFISADKNECSSSPCQNGATCVDGVNHYNCTCSLGYNGVHCEVSKYQKGARIAPCIQILISNINQVIK